MQLLPAEDAAARRLARWADETFGPRLRAVTLFGSRARGEGDEDSDLDVLVVVDGLSFQEAREIAFQCGDLMTDYDVLVSALSMSTERFAELRSLERLIVREIDRDGISLLDGARGAP